MSHLGRDMTINRQLNRFTPELTADFGYENLPLKLMFIEMIEIWTNACMQQGWPIILKPATNSGKGLWFYRGILPPHNFYMNIYIDIGNSALILNDTELGMTNIILAVVLGEK